MGKKYTTDELEVGGHMLDASMMGSLNTIVSAGSHTLAGYLTTYTDTTYSVGNGGLTEINFTSALNIKLAGIATGANNYVLPFTNNSANWNTAYGWGNHAGLYAAASHSHAQYIVEGGTSFSGVYPMVVRVGATSYYSDQDITFTGASSQLYVGGSIRTPTLYDSNNTGYYVDPASTSNFNTLNVSTINRNPVVTLSGDVSGSATMTNLGSINISASVNHDSHNHTYLTAVDDRDVKPNTSGIGTGVKGIKSFFSSLQGMTSTANTDYQDLLVLDTYSDLSGGKANAITFDKSLIEMRLWQANHDATSWGTPQTVLHTGNFVAGVNYQAAGTYNTVIGTDADINTSGATIIDNLYMTDGVITSHGTRNLTLADLGYTGATNANYITNNNQLTNGASYLTTSGKAADSNLLDGIDSASFLRSDTTDHLTSTIYNRGYFIGGENGHRNKGLFGVYDSYRTSPIWSMGTAYKNHADGTNFGNLYGLAYKHTNNPTGGTMGGGHQMVWAVNGTAKGSIGDDAVWHAASMKAPIFYDSNNTAYQLDLTGTSRATRIQADYIGSGIGANTSGSYRLNMGGNIRMNNNGIDYASQLHFNSNVRFYQDSNDSYLNFKYGDATTGGIKFLNGGGTLKGYVFANAESFGLLDASGNWAVKTAVGAAPLTLSSNSNPEFYVYDSYTVSPGSSRAPIFYDYNNTGFYLDPAGTSLMNSIVFTGNSTPIVSKYSGKKSWVQHITTDAYIFAPSTAIDGTSWDWPNQTKFGADGTVTAKNFILSSDERLKTKIVDLSCDNIDVNWKSFEMTSSEGEYRTGVIAQELEQKHPEFVNTDNEGFKSVKYIDLLIAKIAELEARLEKLEK